MKTCDVNKSVALKSYKKSFVQSLLSVNQIVKTTKELWFYRDDMKQRHPILNPRFTPAETYSPITAKEPKHKY